RCNRGSSNLPADYDASIINYVKETKRVIVELSTQRENNGNKLKTAEKPKEFANGRIRGFVERLLTDD
ncbi:MAG TPA: hypothetical protein VMW36_01755, partial [Patescibacteria group bacterium]|nr:hypothetical protein [Patescibacteria group bacterium]